MNVVKNRTIITEMEKWAPQSLAYEWDNVGLQIGSFHTQAKKVMITLDVLESVVDEAIKNDIDLIIAHHPLLFKPINQIDFDSPKGKIIKKLIKHDITVYASHTNLDIASGGINDLLSHALKLKDCESLIHFKREKLLKLITFVPLSHVDHVRDALSSAGAGHIGNYSHCTFQSEGEGTFMPLEGTNPHIGSQNKLEMVIEKKIETIIKDADFQNVIEAMKKAHPYEEVAYDVYPLLNEGESYGLGRIGRLEKSVRLDVFCDMIKKALDVSHLRVTGDITKTVQKVAIVGGSGEKFIHQAKQQGADVYITGDMTFHQAQDAMEMDLAVIDAGHYIEKIMKEATKKYLENKFTERSLQFIVSEENTEPFQFI